MFPAYQTDSSCFWSKIGLNAAQQRGRWYG